MLEFLNFIMPFVHIYALYSYHLFYLYICCKPHDALLLILLYIINTILKKFLLCLLFLVSICVTCGSDSVDYFSLNYGAHFTAS